MKIRTRKLASDNNLAKGSALVLFIGIHPEFHNRGVLICLKVLLIIHWQPYDQKKTKTRIKY